jgi:hypothetical protein
MSVSTSTGPAGEIDRRRFLSITAAAGLIPARRHR